MTVKGFLFFLLSIFAAIDQNPFHICLFRLPVLPLDAFSALNVSFSTLCVRDISLNEATSIVPTRLKSANRFFLILLFGVLLCFLPEPGILRWWERTATRDDSDLS